MKTTIAGKKVLVTGASSGIGRALARTLATKGAVLAIAARRAAALEELADEIAAAGGVRPVVLAADLSVRGAAADLGARALAALGGVDILVNNAGVGIGGSQWVVGDGEAGRELFETNFWAPLALIRALVPSMRERGSGAVVNVSSIGAVAPVPLTGHYNASKAALSMATEVVTLELRGSGVHVLHLVPGPVETPMMAEAQLIPGADRALKRTPMGTPDKLAALTVRALERGRGRVVYPRSMGILYVIPAFARSFARWISKSFDAGDPRIVRGGSGGDGEAREARNAFELSRRQNSGESASSRAPSPPAAARSASN